MAGIACRGQGCMGKGGRSPPPPPPPPHLLRAEPTIHHSLPSLTCPAKWYLQPIVPAPNRFFATSTSPLLHGKERLERVAMDTHGEDSPPR